MSYDNRGGGGTTQQIILNTSNTCDIAMRNAPLITVCTDIISGKVTTGRMCWKLCTEPNFTVQHLWNTRVGFDN